MKRYFSFFLTLVFLLPSLAHAFCGFYVAKADTKLFNKASQVVLVKDGDKTVITMASDYEGDPKEFAIVVPVPTVLEKEQIHVTEKLVLDRIDSYSAPRLVEYFDPDPCQPQYAMEAMSAAGAGGSPRMMADTKKAKSLGVTIEAQYTVGEYDILILSAKESGGLKTWLTESGYKMPAGAGPVLDSYIKQNMKFFVAKVNLQEKAKGGFTYLRPIQMAFDSPKFMLPIRLGTVNANGPQDLFVYALTKKGRVESTNYRTVKLPEGMELPVYVKNKFGDFYKDMFSAQVKKENSNAVFQEYAWDMGWCDPCAADPLSADELRKLGVFWAGSNEGGLTPIPMNGAIAPQSMPIWRGGGGAQNVFLTRLHVRYDQKHFPEDLTFQETSDRTNFQARFVLRHPFGGEPSCEAAKAYKEGIKTRMEKEATTLASLTGWEIGEIRSQMKFPTSGTKEDSKWWKKLW